MVERLDLARLGGYQALAAVAAERRPIAREVNRLAAIGTNKLHARVP